MLYGIEITSSKIFDTRCVCPNNNNNKCARNGVGWCAHYQDFLIFLNQGGRGAELEQDIWSFIRVLRNSRNDVIVTERYDVIFNRNVSNRGVIPLRSSSTPIWIVSMMKWKSFTAFLETNPDKGSKMRESKSVAPKPVQTGFMNWDQLGECLEDYLIK